MNAAETLQTRTIAAAKLHFGEDDMPCMLTLRDCVRTCLQMNIDPYELCDDESGAWSTIKLLTAASQGAAIFSFRGDADATIVTSTVETAADSFRQAS